MRPLLGMLLTSLLVAGCQGTNNHSNNGGGSGSGAHIVTRIVTPSQSTKATRVHPLAVGQSAGGSLSSLKYYIGSIQICEDLTITGSAYSNANGCLSLHDIQSTSQYTYDPATSYTNLADVARADTDPSHFVDLIDPAGRAALQSTTSLSSSDAHDYNWGVVNWLPVVKFTADVTVGSTTLHTHDGVASHADFGYQTTAATALTEGSAEEAVVLHSNGGSYFRFQSPMHIAASDLSSNPALALDLVFNPDGIIKGYSGSSSGSGQLTDSAGNRLAVPFLALTPIPHAASETVSREAYMIHVTGDQPFDIRFDLYILTSDPNKTVYGVEAETLYSAGLSNGLSDFPKIVSIEADSGAGELQFAPSGDATSSTHGPAVVRHFVRTPASAAMVELDCTGGFQVPGCGEGDHLNVSYEYLGTSTL